MSHEKKYEHLCGRLHTKSVTKIYKNYIFNDLIECKEDVVMSGVFVNWLKWILIKEIHLKESKWCTKVNYFEWKTERKEKKLTPEYLTKEWEKNYFWVV